MKPEQQRIAIAEACGWIFDHVRNDAMYYLPEKDFHVGDPLRDLNAAHEMEKILTPPNCETWLEWTKYEKELISIMDSRFISRATAAQRAEAFLRTIGKWTETNSTKEPTHL